MSLAELARRVIEEKVSGGYDNRISVFEHVAIGVGDDGSFEPEGRDRASLEEAIDQAFLRHDATAATWGEATDCDRLSRVFAALTADGIECVENCGFDLQEGSDRVIDAALAHEELTGSPTRGFCFFHRQDVDTAVAGHGLSLAFGAFEEADVPAPAPVVCPTCAGRGWIQPDPNRFPEPCPSHRATQVEPRRTSVQRVGDAIVSAFSAAGFEVQWVGDEAKRIVLPNFTWRRRRVRSTETDRETFWSSWELELRARQPPAEPLALVQERAADWFSESPDLSGAMLQRFEADTLRFLEEARAREAGWPVTDNDRLSAALQTLEATGVLAPGLLGKTLLDGWAYAGLEAVEGRRGVVFFHREDVIDAAAGQGLWLAFASLPAGGDTWDGRTQALGREVVEALDAHGLSGDWSGAALERIRISPFTWQRRRWTTPPPIALRTPRTFAATRSPVEGPTAARALGEVVVGLRDERGFDLRRARRFRETWQKAGHPGEAQVGHLGRPHAFVRPGERTTMMPVAAVANVLASAERMLEVAASWPKRE